MKVSYEKDAYVMLNICPHSTYPYEKEGRVEKDKSCKTLLKLAILILTIDDDYLNIDEHEEEIRFWVKEFYT